MYRIIILILISTASFGQVMQLSNGSRVDQRYITTLGFRLPHVCWVTGNPNLLNYSAYNSKGAMVYDTCAGKIKRWDGSTWVAVQDSTSGGGGDYVDTIYRKAGQDSIFFTINGGTERAIKDSLGGGGGIPIDSVAIKWNSTASSFYSFNGGGANGGSTATRYNIGIGRLTLNKTTDGGFNVAIGDSALSQIALTGANQNTAIGYRSQSRSTGANNVSIGALTLQTGSTSNIVAIGSGVGANGMGANNVAIGFESAFSNMGGNSTAVGYRALRATGTGGTGNTAFGNDALTAVTTGDDNTGIGYSAGVNTADGSNNTFVGRFARAASNASQVTIVGSTAGNASLAGNNTAVGYLTLLTQSTGNASVAMGASTLRYGTGQGNTAVGSLIGSTAGTFVGGEYNAIYGYESGNLNTSGDHNTAIGGYRAAYGLSTGIGNTFLGSEVTNTATALITGDNNIAIGRRAELPSNTSSNQIVLATGGTSPVSRLTMFTGLGWLFNNTSATVTTQTASAALEVNGTTGAVLFPRLTTTQRDALTATNGMVIYNSTTDKLQVRAAGAWVDLH